MKRASKRRRVDAWSSSAATALLIGLLTLVAYLPALEGELLWDDDVHVLDKIRPGGWQGLQRIWTEPGTTQEYYPLLHTAFWLESRLWGTEPLGYHLVNILLHAANAILIWRILLRLEVPGSLLAATLFAIHPVNVESVAWITELKNVLSGFFFFVALAAYLRFCPIRPLAGSQSFQMVASSESDRRSERLWYVASLGAFIAALLCKTVTCVLPIVILLLLWWERGKVSLRHLSPLVPMILLGAAAGTVTIWVETELLGAKGTTWSLGWSERVLIAGRAL